MNTPDSPQPAAGTEFAQRELGTPYPAFPALLPDQVVEAGRYRVRFAGTVEDLDAIERLRFEIFNLELGEGLDSAYQSGRDHDDLDPFFHHLLIECRETEEVVGTYRLQTGDMAARHRGFYSAREFDLSGLPAGFLDQAVEVGRACVARDHRNGRVLNLLWRGLALYLTRNRKRFIFGCCSLTSQDPALGMATLRQLIRDGHVDPMRHAPPLDGMACDTVDPAESATREVHIPALFQSYLTLGAKVLGPPAIDRQFKTIDFLVALDVDGLDQHRYRFFFR